MTEFNRTNEIHSEDYNRIPQTSSPAFPTQDLKQFNHEDLKSFQDTEQEIKDFHGEEYKHSDNIPKKQKKEKKAKRVKLDKDYSHIIKNHMCHQCSKAFPRQSELDRHILRVHGEEKPHECDGQGCKKTFATIYDLLKHKRKTHDKGPDVYFCNICLMKFNDRSIMKMHKSQEHKKVGRIFFRTVQ